MKLVQNPHDLLKTEYSLFRTRFDVDHGVLWSIAKQDAVPCVTPQFLRELKEHQREIADSQGRLLVGEELHDIRFSVLASITPGVFSLGGQLALFRELIRKQDRESLLHYATACIDVIYPRTHHFDLPLVTISLLQGDALGGGLEGALTSDIIIAERKCQLGFPEILFNLFPGMGAYSLIARKVSPKFAEKMILSGKMYSAEELYEAGLIDILAEDGKGVEAVNEYIRETGAPFQRFPCSPESASSLQSGYSSGVDGYHDRLGRCGTQAQRERPESDGSFRALPGETVPSAAGPAGAGGQRRLTFTAQPDWRRSDTSIARHALRGSRLAPHPSDLGPRLPVRSLRVPVSGCIH